MTIIEQLEAAKQRIKTLEGMLATKATAATTAPAPSILDKYNAMAPGKAKDEFLKANHRELFALSKAKAAAAVKPSAPVNITK